MFSDIHHISYLVPDLDAAIDSYAERFEATVTGRGTVPDLGEVAFLQVGDVEVGDVEVEFICPVDPSALAEANEKWVVHHMAYVVGDLDRVVAEHRQRGYSFVTDEPFTNFMGYRLIYLDPADTGGCLVHLTDAESLRGGGSE